MKPRLACSVLALLALAQPGFGEGITLTVEGVRNDRGALYVFVFDKASAFDSLNVWRSKAYAKQAAQTGSMQVTFPKCTEGPYAVFLFHDQNDDNDLNAKGDRLLEGVGASGAPNPEDEPSFAEASIWPGDTTIRIHYDQ